MKYPCISHMVWLGSKPPKEIVNNIIYQALYLDKCFNSSSNMVEDHFSGMIHYVWTNPPYYSLIQKMLNRTLEKTGAILSTKINNFIQVKCIEKDLLENPNFAMMLENSFFDFSFFSNDPTLSKELSTLWNFLKQHSYAILYPHYHYQTKNRKFWTQFPSHFSEKPEAFLKMKILTRLIQMETYGALSNPAIAKDILQFLIPRFYGGLVHDAGLEIKRLKSKDAISTDLRLRLSKNPLILQTLGKTKHPRYDRKLVDHFLFFDSPREYCSPFILELQAQYFDPRYEGAKDFLNKMLEGFIVVHLLGFHEWSNFGRIHKAPYDSITMHILPSVIYSYYTSTKSLCLKKYNNQKLTIEEEENQPPIEIRNLMKALAPKLAQHLVQETAAYLFTMHKRSFVDFPLIKSKKEGGSQSFDDYRDLSSYRPRDSDNEKIYMRTSIPDKTIRLITHEVFRKRLSIFMSNQNSTKEALLPIKI